MKYNFEIIDLTYFDFELICLLMKAIFYK